MLLGGCLQINSPQKNEIVTGTITITAVETEAAEVYQNNRVDFYIDGVFLGFDTATPFQVNWNTTTAADGAHTILVKAYSITQSKWLESSTPVSVNNTTAPGDTTPPTIPVVTDDGSSTISPNQLRASWNAVDPQGGIAEYQYAIGTSPTTADVRPWTSAGVATTITVNNLSLANGQTYYFLVKARNPVNLWSNIGASDGISVVLNEEAKAYLHLYERMDAYANGGTQRLIESYLAPYPPDQQGFGWVYDNALAISVLLARGTAEDRRRARVLCDTLISLQDRQPDGRLWDAYDARYSTLPIAEAESRLGDLAWVLIAWMEYYRFSGDADATFRTRLLNAAIRLGDFIEAQLRDPANPGYRHHPGVGYKSTEQHTALYAAFSHLYAVTQQPQWKARAHWALAFMTSGMWKAQRFWVGSTDNGWSTNDLPTQQATDANALPVIALGPKYGTALSSIFWSVATTADGFDGFDYNTDQDGVWFEGTAQMALAYQAINNASMSQRYVDQLKTAQTDAPNANGKGITATAHSALTTGFGWNYYPSLHIAPTSWYIAALRGYNPFLGTPTNYTTPILIAGYDQIAGANQTVGFNAAGSIDPSNLLRDHRWDFGDGQQATGASATHAYAAPGFYTVTLTADDGTGRNFSDVLFVTVKQPPVFPLFWKAGLGSYGNLDRGWATNGGWSHQLAAQDLDGDGKTEVLLGNTQGFLTIMGHENGSYQPLWQSDMLGWVISSVSIGNVDADSTPEVLATEFRTGGFGKFYLYDGASRVLVQQQSLSSIASSAIADVDGDGANELLFGTASGTIVILDGQTLTQKGTITGLVKVVSLAVGDGDQDGVQEIYAADDLTVKVFDGISHVKEWESPLQYQATALALANLDADTTLELVVTTQLGSVSVYNAETLTQDWTSQAFGSSIGAATVGDPDNDGSLEIIFGADRSVYVLDGQTRAVKWQGGAYDDHVSGVAVADTDGDGNKEIVVLTDRGSLNIIDGLNHAIEFFREGISAFGTATGDLDGDGAQEIALGTINGQCRILDGSSRQEKWRLEGLGGEVNAVAVADTEGDGSRELIVGANRTLAVYGGISRQQLWQTTLGSAITKVAVADIDADGTREMVAGTTGGFLYVFNGATKALEWQNGSALPPLAYGALALADVDDDGSVEIIVGSGGYTSAGVVYIYDGATKQVEWVSGNLGSGGIRNAIAIDVDANGSTELVAGGHTGLVTIFNGATKEVLGQVDSGGYLYGIAVGDVDADPTPEIVTSAGTADWTALRVFDGISREVEWSSDWLGEAVGNMDSLQVTDLDGDLKTEILAGGLGYVHLFGTEGVPELDDFAPPSVQITSPAAGTTISGAVTIQVSAGDNTGIRFVELTVNERPLVTLTEPPYTYTWNAASWPEPAYIYNIQAKAHDLGRNTAADSVSIINPAADPKAPTLNPVVSPTAVNTQTLTGQKEPYTAIRINGVEKVALDAQTAFSANVSLVSGANTFSVVARGQNALDSPAAVVSIILDTTPPTAPVVTDDGATTHYMSRLHFSVSSSDAQTGIAEYQYAIGTSPGATNVRDWTSSGTATDITATGLSLAYNTAYYVAARSRNGAGLLSATGVSDGIVVLERPPVISASQPPDTTRLLQGSAVSLSVTASDPDAGDTLQSRFLIGETVLKDWSAVHTLAWTVPQTLSGDQTIMIEVKDPWDGLAARAIAVWVVVKPVDPPSP